MTMLKGAKDSGRQQVIMGHVDITPDSFADGLAPEIFELPGGAVILRGYLHVREAFDVGTLSIGTSDDAVSHLAATALTATGMTAITIDGAVVDNTMDLIATASELPSEGKASLVIEYFVEGRSAFSQGKY